MKVPVPPSPKKKLGQNFLVDGNVLDNIVAALELSPSDHVLEIGAGTGALTSRVAPLVQRLVAVEKDRDLIPYLQNIPGVEILNADIREVELRQVAGEGKNRLRILGNLPYYISTAVLTRLVKQRQWIRDMVLTFQQEVAARILASPSTPDYGYLSVVTQYFCDVEKGFRISRNSFIPRPEVESRVLLFQFHPDCRFDFDEFSAFLIHAFSHRRKKLRKNILAVPGAGQQAVDGAFASMQLTDNTRAENLSAEQYEQLIALLHP
jgi:16S rRNA (adenine1518-N6/adenine1519-N6)-dimethyltransferase